ncbi:hypothetical protein TNCV_831091 [Trichonephila clavipes]|nr:hypothetical protein TNCV_831091 [Trichonephila clavipes]
MDFGAPLTIGEAYLKIIISSFLGFCEWNTRNRWRDGQVCPDVDKELWRLEPDGSGDGRRPERRGRGTRDKRVRVTLDRFSVHRCPTRRVFSGTGLELVTKPATIRCLYHSATAATQESPGERTDGEREENPRVLIRDAVQESKTRMSKNALRTGRRQAVE